MRTLLQTRWLRPLGRLEKLTWAVNLFVIAGMLTLGYTIGAFTNTSKPIPTLMSTGKIDITVASGTDPTEASAGIINFNNTQPGQTQQNTITIGNTGTLPFSYSVSAALQGDQPLFDAIQAEIKNGQDQIIYSGSLSGLTQPQTIADRVPAGSSDSVSFRVWLPDNAGPELMDKKGTATFSFVASQLRAPQESQ